MNIFLVTRTLSQSDANNLNADDLTVWHHYNPISTQRGLKKLGIENLIIPLNDLKYRCNYDKAPNIIFDCYPPWNGDNDIKILKKFKYQGAVIVNDIDAYYKCHNKWLQYTILHKAGVAVPKTIKLDLPLSDIDLELIRSEFGFPVIIKSTSGSKGICVFKCHTEDDIWNACREIMITTKYSITKTNLAIVQKWIDHKNTLGIMRVCVVGGKAICAEQRYPEDPNIDFFNSNSGSKTIHRHHYEMTANLRYLVESACLALNVEIAAIDVLHDGKDFLICEINAPGSLMFADRQKDIQYDVGMLIAQHLASKLDVK
jgi:gamma-F420-2:alpha-L-glutamate ligase